MFNTFGLFIVIVLNICCVYCDAQFQLGSSCNKGEGPGTCELIANCPKAFEEIKSRVFPKLCGFNGKIPIACCLTPKPEKKNPSNDGAISKAKCQEYGKYVFEWETPPTLGFLQEPPINVSKCGFESKPLIIGGEDALVREFPHMALLGYGKTESTRNWSCGGTLISEEFVLTAGHCIFSREFGIVRWVRLGELNIAEKTDAKHADFSIVEKIPHPFYKPPSRYNDIALLKIDRPATLNSFIRPACLHTPSLEILDSKFIATGWGLTDRNGDKGSDHLQKVVLEMFGYDKCNVSYANIITDRLLKNGINLDSQMCAGSADSINDTCQGDSGGPLQIYHPKLFCMYSIVGVTSFGKTCGVQGIPGVYSRVSNYLDWIEETVWPQG